MVVLETSARGSTQDMEILPIPETIDEPEPVEVPFVEQPESYSDIAMLDSAEIAATFDALTQGPDVDMPDVMIEPEVPPTPASPVQEVTTGDSFENDR